MRPDRSDILPHLLRIQYPYGLLDLLYNMHLPTHVTDFSSSMKRLQVKDKE